MLLQGFEDSSYDELSAIGTPEILLNIVSWRGCVWEDTPIFILTCRRKLVKYYLSKDSVILEKYSLVMMKLKTRFKQ